MNYEDKIRFARYKKGYIVNEDEDEDKVEDENSKLSKNNKLGYINHININSNNLIKDIIDKSNKK